MNNRDSIERMEMRQNTLFLYGTGRFFVYAEDILRELSIEDQSYIYDFTFSQDGSLWLTTPNII